MDRISVTLPDDLIVRLSEVVDESYDNRSEAVRDLLAKGLEYDDRVTDLERENERLRNEKRTIIEQREEHTELVKAVKEERSLAKRKAEAGVLTRAKWWFTGMSNEEQSGD